MNLQCTNGRVRHRMGQPSHEWMCARMNEYISTPPNQPLYQYHQPNTKRPWGAQRQKNEAAAGRGHFYLCKLGSRESGTPNTGTLKMKKRETAARMAKANRLGGPKGDAGTPSPECNKRRIRETTALATNA